MGERKLRFNGKPEPHLPADMALEAEDARKLRSESMEMREKVDHLYMLHRELEEEATRRKKVEKEFKEREDALKVKINESLSQVKDFAQKHDLKTIETQNAMVTFKTSMSRNIHPKKLLSFLKEQNRVADFWRYTKVTMSPVIKDFGEGVLQAHGILETDFDEYGNVAITKSAGIAD